MTIFQTILKKELNYELTNDQTNALNEINNDLKSEKNVQTFTRRCWKW